MIDRIRYAFGIISVVTLPPGLLFWFIIHPLARWWRRLGPARTYAIVVPVVMAVGAGLFPLRRQLLGADLGTNGSLIAVVPVLYVVVIGLELRYWKHVKIATLIGIPELSPAGQHTGRLLREGIYGVIRHPRYASAGLGVVANALFINYIGMYFLILWVFPLGYVMLMLEERELVGRFGEAYREYQRDVPQLIPRWPRRYR